MVLSAVEVANKNASNEVVEGAVVKAVFLELWTIGSVSDQFFTIFFAKYKGGQADASFTEMTDLTSYDNKANILWTTQGLASNDGIGNPVAVHRGWIKIPKSKQRMALGDNLRLQVASRGSANIDFCGIAIYKEYQ